MTTHRYHDFCVLKTTKCEQYHDAWAAAGANACWQYAPPAALRRAGLVWFDLIQVVDVLSVGSFIQTPPVCLWVRPCEFQWCPAVFQCCTDPTVDIWLLFSLASGCKESFLSLFFFFFWFSAYYSVKSTINAIILSFFLKKVRVSV